MVGGAEWLGLEFDYRFDAVDVRSPTDARAAAVTSSTPSDAPGGTRYDEDPARIGSSRLDRAPKHRTLAMSQAEYTGRIYGCQPGQI
jgi:hypothetical protein